LLTTAQGTSNDAGGFYYKRVQRKEEKTGCAVDVLLLPNKE
jgi:hypothetical protein